MLLSIFLALPGYGSIILIVLAILLLFGGKKIPELMKGLGRGMKEFKDATKEDGSSEASDSNKDSK